MTGSGAWGTAVPHRIVVAGDWHGNRWWALNVIRRLPQLLASEQRRIILHLGDFGIWPGGDGRRYLGLVSSALAEQDAELWFVDGNHEDFSQLESLSCGMLPDGRVPVLPRFITCPVVTGGRGTGGAGLPAAAESAWTEPAGVKAATGGRRRRSPMHRSAR
jgi:hypothetical protein